VAAALVQSSLLQSQKLLSVLVVASLNLMDQLGSLAVPRFSSPSSSVLVHGTHRGFSKEVRDVVVGSFDASLVLSRGVSCKMMAQAPAPSYTEVAPSHFEFRARCAASSGNSLPASYHSAGSSEDVACWDRREFALACPAQNAAQNLDTFGDSKCSILNLNSTAADNFCLEFPSLHVCLHKDPQPCTVDNCD
jgi:hypothetical protein